MTGCTATLKTATVTFCGPEPCLEVETCIPYEGGWSHVLVHTIRCERTNADHAGWDHCSGGAGGPSWYDDTPGATPHADPSASDVEVQAIALAWLDLTGTTMPKDRARRLAEAAAEARTA